MTHSIEIGLDILRRGQYKHIGIMIEKRNEKGISIFYMIGILNLNSITDCIQYRSFV